MSTPLSNIPKGLFLASLLLLAWLGVFAVIVRWNSLPEIAKFLPAENTQAFWILDLADVKSVEVQIPAKHENFMGTSIGELPWITRFGGAWLSGQDLSFVEVSSKAQAQSFLDKLKAPEESYEGTEVYCYTQSQPYCFTWIESILFTSYNEELLTSIQETRRGEQASLASQAKYQNIRSRLAHWNSGFYYIDLQTASARFMNDFGAVAALLELFPATGGVFKTVEGTILEESFLAMDKNILGGEAFYHPTEPYEKKLLPWSSAELAWEWGGQNLAAQWNRVRAILEQKSPSSALVWESETKRLLETWFGPDFDAIKELAPLLDQEQYFGFTPQGDVLFLAELEPEEDMQVEALSARLKANGDKLKLVYSSRVLILSNSETLALSTLDKALGREPSRDLKEMGALLSGSDEVMILHCPLLPDGNILKTLGGNFESIFSTRKLFDDGVFTRTAAQP